MKFKELTNIEVAEIRKAYDEGVKEGCIQDHNDDFQCIGHVYDFVEDNYDIAGLYYRTWVFVRINKDKKEYSTILLHDLGNQWSDFAEANFNNEKVEEAVENLINNIKQKRN